MPEKKKFFEVEIPLTNTSVEILAFSINSLNNRTIRLDLTRQLRGKSIEVVFRVGVEDNKAIAFPIKLTLLPFFIRRMLRRNISYVEDSFSVECKDSFIRIKPFLITRKKVSRAIRKGLRDEARNWLTDYSKNKTNKEIFSDIISNRLQKPLSLKLKKIYPLALCEIRILKLEKLKEQEKLKITVEKVEKAEEEKVEDKKIEEKTEKKREEEKEKEVKKQETKKKKAGKKESKKEETKKEIIEKPEEKEKKGAKEKKKNGD